MRHSEFSFHPAIIVRKLRNEETREPAVSAPLIELSFDFQRAKKYPKALTTYGLKAILMSLAMDHDAGNSSYNYVVTAHKPTAVNHSCVGNFTSNDDLNLILSKSTRLEIHKLTQDGLQGVIDVPIFGRISVLKLFRPQGGNQDLLFILTEKYKFCVLAYDGNTGVTGGCSHTTIRNASPFMRGLVTRAHGDVSDKVGRPCEAGQIGIIDPESRVIVLHLYDGNLKVIPIDEAGALSEAFNVRLEELKVLDLGFLHDSSTPTLVVLYEDTKGQRHIKTYEISIKDKELVEGPWAESSLDPGSNLIIPVRRTSGAIVVGEQAAVFLSRNSRSSCTFKPTLSRAYASVDEDGSRYLLGDFYGNLFLLALESSSSAVTGLKLEILGKTSQASTLAYLDSGIVFVGSCFGDSQLIRLCATPSDAQSENYVEVIDTMVNIGPIVDFCVMDLDRQGQGQVVTCSGAGKDGSLRIVRSGIGFIEQASVELSGIKGIWSLRENFADEHDTYILLSFVGQTRVLGLNMEDELDEADIEGLDPAAQTLWCGNMVHNQLVQVSNVEIRLIRGDSKALCATWRPRNGASITVASGTESQICCAVNNGSIVYITVDENKLSLVSEVNVEQEVSCLDLTPIGQTTGKQARSNMLVIGTWSMNLEVYLLPSLERIATNAIGGEVMPRSVLLASFHNEPYLLCGLGDGTLLSFGIEEGLNLVDKKRLALGTKPITLRHFRSRGINHVFAASDRPTVIYSANNKLLFSNLNENEVGYITSFHTASFPDNLALVKPNGLAIGVMDSIQKLHIRTVPLHEQARRISHQESSRTFLVAITNSAFSSQDVDSLRLLDDQTFETLDVYKLGPHEMACSTCNITFSDDSAEYYAVGTALLPPDELEPSRGRILLFQIHNSKLHAMSETETRGAVYNITPFQGKLLSGINSRVQLYRWEQFEDGARKLVPECSHGGHVIALFVDVRGDFVLVGDLMKSLQLLLYNHAEGKFELRARDFNPAWMCAATVLDDEIYLGAENNYNLFTVRKNDEAVAEEERCRLEVIGQFHLGEFINRFRRGSLVMRLPDSELANVPTVLFGTVNGVIGVIASLPFEIFSVLLKLQEAMRKVVKGVGGFEHSEWRSFVSPFAKPAMDSSGFIDGDLIEQFLDLKRESMDAVLREMPNLDRDTILRVVEDLSRLH